MSKPSTLFFFGLLFLGSHQAYGCDFSALQDIDCSVMWEPWKVIFDKSYATKEEEAYRFEVFCSSWEHIKQHNTNPGNGWTMDMNHFADLTPEEWKARHASGFRIHTQPPSYGEHTFQYDDFEGPLPSSVNWVTRGRITAVKNQGQCGSCWSFSTTGAVEGHVAIAHNAEPVSLSEQELVDCSTSYGDHGCDGGMMDFGFEYVQKNGGLCAEEAYPYEAKQGMCRSSSCNHVSPIKGYSNVQPRDEAALMAAVAKGPVSIAIEADQSAFQFYRSGVMDGSCGRATDHGVLVVGYGHDEDQHLDYWLVKNSWGPVWGEQGYIRLARNATLNDGFGQCGILSTPSFPLV